MGACEEADATLKGRLFPLESEQIVAGGLGSGIAQVPLLWTAEEVWAVRPCSGKWTGQNSLVTKTAASVTWLTQRC